MRGRDGGGVGSLRTSMQPLKFSVACLSSVCFGTTPVNGGGGASWGGRKMVVI